LPPKNRNWQWIWQVDSRQVQCLQRIHDSRGGKFDGKVREIMILVEFKADRQNIVADANRR